MKPGISSLVTPFTIQQFMELFQKPYDQFKAFREGAIDAEGNLSNKGRISPLEFLVIKIRKWLEQLYPSVTKNMLGSYAGMYNLMYESAKEKGIDLSKNISGMELIQILECIQLGEESLSLDRYLSEEMTSGGAGLGVASNTTAAGGIQGYDLPMGSVQKRNLGVSMYEVQDEEELKNFVASNYYKRLKERSKNSKIAVRMANTKSVRFL